MPRGNFGVRKTFVAAEFNLWRSPDLYVTGKICNATCDRCIPVIVEKSRVTR